MIEKTIEQRVRERVDREEQRAYRLADALGIAADDTSARSLIARTLLVATTEAYLDGSGEAMGARREAVQA